MLRRGYALEAPRCVLCSARAAGSARLSARGAVSLQVPLCARHLSLRRRGGFAAWGCGLLGLAALIVGLASDLLPLALLGVYALIAGPTYAAVTRRSLTLDRADRHFIRLRGADLRYLDSLRSWGDYPEPRA